MLPVLRKPRFLVFATTQAVSLFGDKLDYMALLALFAWFSRQSGWAQSRALATLSVISALPTILFGPVAGVLVDRWDRRRVMITCDAIRALLVLGVPLLLLATGRIEVVFALAFGVFLCGLFFNTARMAILPGLVDAEHGQNRANLLGANSLMNVTGRIATFLGMFLGGFVVDWTGWSGLGIRPSWSAGFYLDGLTYVVSVVGLIAIYRTIAPLAAPARRAGTPGATLFRAALDRLGHAFADFTDAWKLIVRTPSVIFVYCSVLAFVVIGAGVLILYIPLIQGMAGTGLNLGTRGVGLIAGVGSVGLLLSSVGYGFVGNRFRKHTVLLGAFLLLGTCALVLSFTDDLRIVLPGAFLAGLAISPIYIGMDTLVHESVPAEVRGRVFSNREWVLHLGFATTALILGQLTRVIPNRTLLAAVGAAVLAASVVGFFVTRNRNIG
jgi:DHA3 family macrolide efflux protein-like MFS transporter